MRWDEELGERVASAIRQRRWVGRKYQIIDQPDHDPREPLKVRTDGIDLPERLALGRDCVIISQLIGEDNADGFKLYFEVNW